MLHALRPHAPAGVLIVSLLAACSSAVDSINDRAVLAQSDANAAAPAMRTVWLPPVKTEYRIGARDLLEIEVYELEEPDTTKVLKTRVAQDGDIVLPLIGSIRAADRTSAELQAEIERRLAADFMVDPSVNVLVADYQARSVTVLGAVDQPGRFHLQENSTTLIDALAAAGGVTEDAGTTVYVVRAGDGSLSGAPAALGDVAEASSRAAAKPGVLRIDLQDLVEHGDLSTNCSLQDGDVVQVPPVPHFFVTGRVRAAGSFPLRGQISVLKAIAMAGGLEDEASPSSTVLIRQTPQGRVTLPIDLNQVEADTESDVVLQADDVLVISESGTSRVMRGFTDLLHGLFHIGYTF